jgi:pimeloyl-ACP methyl ester carboxylesterase
MPFANKQGVQIYYEVEGQGPPLILAHGITGDTTFWRGYGYVEQLQDQYTVILFDARGHGKSDKPHEVAAYSHDQMIGDIIAIMDDLDIHKTYYWGYSMGGYVGFHLAKIAPGRIISLIAGGTDPMFAAQPNFEPSPLLTIFQRGITEGTDAIVEGMCALFGSLTPQYETRLRSLDPQAMAACMENAEKRPGLDKTVLSLTMPCLFYAGEEDDGCYQGSQRAAEQMRNGRFFSLPSLNHVSASVAVDAIVPEVLSFLAVIAT